MGAQLPYPRAIEPEALADQLLYLLDHPNQLFCHPCLSRLAEVSAKLSRTNLERFSDKLFSVSHGICKRCGTQGTVLTHPANLPWVTVKLTILDALPEKAHEQRQEDSMPGPKKAPKDLRPLTPEKRSEIAARGGNARTKALTPAERSAIAKKAAAARWKPAGTA